MDGLTLDFLCLVILLTCSIEARYNSDQDCTKKYKYRFSYDQCHPDLAKENGCSLSDNQQKWLKSLYNTALHDRSVPKRKRREIRALSDAERQNFFKAVNALKKDTSVPPNQFEVLALVHTNRTLCSAHHGSNFLGWHRVYLLLFETALRQKDSTVSLPYWNSGMDNNNKTGPENTVIFSDSFLGNGNGDVTTGPFSYWTDFRGCPLPRNINVLNCNSLLDPEKIMMIENNVNINLTADVVFGGSSNSTFTIEGQHNLVHDWIGGDMGLLNLSANDPAFMLHHSFVDYIWEKFRQKQKRLGIDPETDYPNIGYNANLRQFNAPNRTMDCFQWMTNIEGYWNNFTDLYEYENSPECPLCGKSRYLTCDRALNRCIGIVPSKNNNHLSPKQIIVIVIGSILGALVLVAVIMACFQRCRSRNKFGEGERESLLWGQSPTNT